MSYTVVPGPSGLEPLCLSCVCASCSENEVCPYGCGDEDEGGVGCCKSRCLIEEEEDEERYF